MPLHKIEITGAERKTEKLIRRCIQSRPAVMSGSRSA